MQHVQSKKETIKEEIEKRWNTKEKVTQRKLGETEKGQK